MARRATEGVRTNYQIRTTNYYSFERPALERVLRRKLLHVIHERLSLGRGLDPVAVEDFRQAVVRVVEKLVGFVVAGEVAAFHGGAGVEAHRLAVDEHGRLQDVGRTFRFLGVRAGDGLGIDADVETRLEEVVRRGVVGQN